MLGEVTESVKTGLWVGDCFIYTNSVNRLNYYVGGEIVTISHLDRFIVLNKLFLYFSCYTYMAWKVVVNCFFKNWPFIEILTRQVFC